jgi:hypothetical protein
LSNNPNITWGIVQANPDKPLDWHGLSINPNITFECDKKKYKYKTIQDLMTIMYFSYVNIFSTPPALVSFIIFF